MYDDLKEHLMEDTRIGSRRFGYLCFGAGPATVAAGLLVIGIVAMMLTLN
jgi:hypothetical protein